MSIAAGNHGTDARLRSRRIPFRQRVLVAPRDGGERRYEESFDLSLGGMFITTMLPLDIGEIVDLDLPLGPLRFQAAANVVWVRGSVIGENEPVGTAVEFIQLNQNQKKLIHRQIGLHTQSGGRLKVGKPSTARREPARAAALVQSRPGLDGESTWQHAVDSLKRLWLIATAAGVVVTAVVLMALV